MSLIKIIANEIELDIVKETLNITKENNALINDYKVSYSDFPFLILENSKTIKALGAREITAINKPKIVPVIVEELNEKYYGELQILSYMNLFRKVTLKYSTELLTIMEKNISNFMPVISVIPDAVNLIPYTEESENEVPGSDNWISYVSDSINKSYPDVKFNFPMMYWKNKFGIDLEPENEWKNYKNHINYFDENGNYIFNYYNVSNNTITIDQRNVPAPQIYLLSPLFYALKSLGWSMEGDFINTEIIKKTVILSVKNNLCKTKVTTIPVLLTYSLPLVWAPRTMKFLGTSYITQGLRLIYTLPSDGKYLFSWKYIITDTTTDPVGYKKTFAEAYGAGDFVPLFSSNLNVTNRVYSGSHEFEGSAGNVINIFYYNLHKKMPVDYTISFLKLEETKVFSQFHPTIDLARYTPDWTFGTYINEMKKLFNLKIEIDDFRKKMSFNFNENLFETSDKVVINKSLLLNAYDQSLYNAYHLKFQNDLDNSLWIEISGAEDYTSQTSDFLGKLESKFKLVPRNGYTAELSEELESKDGVGLMIYNNENSPFIASNYENQTLELNGSNGIYERYWKKWLKFRLNSSHVEMIGYFTEMELSKIQKLQRIYIDMQDYIISSIEYTETDQSNFEVLLKLESVNF